MRKQLPTDAKFFMLSQNGNHAISPDGTILWSETFTQEQRGVVMDFIRGVHDDIRLTVRDEDDLVEERGSQISYSLIGHNEHLETKKTFDSDGSKRRAILDKHISARARLLKAGVEVTIGGTTCLDIYLAGKNKGYHVRRLIEAQHWSKDDSIYVGDALQPGRNDESVIGVIPTREVSGPDDTFSFIKEVLR